MEELGSEDPEQQMRWSAYRPKHTVWGISAQGSSRRPIVLDSEQSKEEDVVMMKGE